MFTANDIDPLAKGLFTISTEPVVRYRLARDVLKPPPHSPELSRLREGALHARWACELAAAQHGDGSWGRFHTRDSRERSLLPSMEFAIQRALALGFDQDSPVMRKAVNYMAGVLTGGRLWQDPAEKNRRWPLVYKVITAGTLALACPEHPALDGLRTVWQEIAVEVFKTGAYSPEREMAAMKRLTGIHFGADQLLLKNKHTLWLLASRAGDLTLKVEEAILDWIWHRAGGIGYLEVALAERPTRRPPSVVDRWLQSLETMSGFRHWQNPASEALRWLWEQRGRDGLWDFGPRSTDSYHFPLSQDWRKTVNRKADYSVFVLCLLRKAGSYASST